MAGNSAEQVARQARERAQRLLTRAEMFERGAAGERAVAEVLAQLPGEWFVLNDIRWPGRARANIDHVVVGPTGVYVIDAKNWSGSVTVARGILRQNGYNRTAAVEGARAAAAAIAARLPTAAAARVVPVVCFAGDGRVTAELDGVVLCSLESLLATLLAPRARLAPEMVQFLRFDLDMTSVAASQSAPSAGHARFTPELRWRPSPTAVPVRPAGHAFRSNRVRGSRARSLGSTVRVFIDGVVGWWLLCLLLYLGLNPVVRSPQRVVPPVCFLAGVGVAALSVARVRAGRRSRGRHHARH